MRCELVADIGGTHTTLAAINQKQHIEYIASIPTKQYDKISELINEFLKNAKEQKNIEVARACFAVAGPILSDTVTMPNTGKTIDKKEILRNTLLAEVYLINDVEALAHAIHTKKIIHENIKHVHGKLNRNERIAIIALGTGFGSATLKPNGEVIPSEYGHAEIIHSSNPSINKAITGIEKKLDRQLEIDDVLSGKGLVRLVEFVKTLPEFHHYKHDKVIQHIFSQNDIANAIAKEKKHPICARAIELFVQMTYAHAMSYALATNCFGGIIFGGGIVTKNPTWFTTKNLKHHQRTKVAKSIPKDIPLARMNNYTATLWGAAYVLKYKNEKQIVQ